MFTKQRAIILTTSIVVLGLMVLIGARFYRHQQVADMNLIAICTSANGCPSEYCKQGCVGGGGDNMGCSLGCMPKDCYKDFDAENCPVGQSCSLWQTSSGDLVCYYTSRNDSRECGEEGYFGQKHECCEGLTRGIGIELPDGSCDLTKGGSQDLFPYCIACGDGQCSTFENKCSCPADCD